ncbi:MAG: helix-turn-helix domain-containing protein [Ktedonobacterales bacterium]
MPFPKIPNIFGQIPRFGDQVRDFRTLRGMSVEEVAREAGLASKALREIESNQRPAPATDMVKALADALHLSKSERESLLDAADFDSPFVNAALGRHPQARPSRPSFTAAILVFLIADIRGYTRFTQEQGDEAAARLTSRFADLARAAIEQEDGHLVEVRGDEVLAVFASARQAVRAAHDMQSRYVDEAHTHPEIPAGIGIGLDVGEAVAVDDGYRGAALNRAARLCCLAGPGEVLVSTGVAYVAPQVEGVRFVPRGQELLKGFDGPVPVLLASPTPASVVEAGAPPPPDDAGDAG